MKMIIKKKRKKNIIPFMGIEPTDQNASDCKSSDCLTDAQFGFKPGYSTVDAVFALHSIISDFLSRKKKLYCCFVDYQKAFDSIDHLKPWRRLVKHGVRGKLLNVIKSMYSQIRSCVKFHGQYSDFYHCYT